MGENLSIYRAVRQYPLHFVFMVLTMVIVLFNYPDVFMSKTLFLDDYDRYVRGLENRVHEYIIDRNFARAYIVFGLYKLLAINVILARFVLVAVFYIPLAFMFFYLLRVYAKLPVYVALFASILPCILPGQIEIPRFIDGSYTLPGLLVYLAMIWSSAQFLKSEVMATGWLVLSAGLCLISVEMMDQAVFMLPVSVIIFYFITGDRLNWSKFGALVAINSIVCVTKAVIILHDPSSTSAPIDFSWQNFIQRFSVFWEYVLPYAYGLQGHAFNSKYLFVTYALLLLVGLYESDKSSRVVIIISIVWAFSASIMFLTISEFYSSRYLHIAAFGINTAMVVCLWQIFTKGLYGSYGNHVFIVFMVAMIAYSGVARISHVYKTISPLNSMQSSIETTFSKYNFPENSQIILLDKYRSPTHGWWRYSVGYMKYTTARADITGQFGEERNYYQPFSVSSRYFVPAHRMSGLDIYLPVFIFRQVCDDYCNHTQIEYALNWTKDEWSLYRFDRDTGVLLEERKGKSYPAYIDTLNNKGIKQEEVAFGAGRPDE